MKAQFHANFDNDLKKLRNATVLRQIEKVIRRVEAAASINEIGQLKRLVGQRYCFRIRVSDYRLGLWIQDDTVTFVRCLHRREIYRFFP